jgi:hypothetical protein
MGVQSVTARIQIPALLLSTMLLAGCAGLVGPTIDVAKLASQPYSAVSAEDVRVLTANSGVNRPFIEIALIDVQEGPGIQTYDEMIQALRKRAGAIGAQAVVIETSKRSAGGMFVGGTFMAIEAKHIRATAIRWGEPPRK